MSLDLMSQTLMHRPKRLLNSNAHTTNTHHSPQPLVLQLIHTGPEGILIRTEVLQLTKLLWVRSRVSALLVFLLLGVAAEEAEEGVVRSGAEEFDGREHVGAVEHDDEGDVYEGVAKVADIILVGVRVKWGKDSVLGVADDAPNTLAHDALATLRLVLVELVVCKCLHGQTRREESDGKHLDVWVVASHYGTFVAELNVEIYSQYTS